jgi:hypothetical protein
MNTRKKISLLAALASIPFLLVGTVWAHNPGYVVASPGKPPATIITINGVEGAGEWAGAYVFAIDYGMGDPFTATVKALHKADGIYLLVVINDTTNNGNDSLQIRFDINHNGTAMTEASDWGDEVRRNGQATWGAANTDPGTWTNIPGANVAVVSGGNSWTVEFHLPTGAPSGLDLGTGTVGIHFMLFDADQAFGANSAKFKQWPNPPIADPHALLDGTPNQWGNDVFDPATTFPNIAVTDVRRADDGPENYYTISHTANNRFDVKVKNPGGTAIANAANVRLNLYLAARGLGEPFHRLDTDGTLDSDCNAYPPASSIPFADVCNGAGDSLPDINTKSINDVVANTAKYTIKDGTNRLDGGSIIVLGGTESYFQVMNWDTTIPQDSFFTSVVVNGSTYNRQHQCMRAEALAANDPNVADNLKQVNMDFVCVPGGGGSSYHFSIGWAGFFKYDPTIGKEMLLQVDLKNMSRQAGWDFKLDGARQVSENVFVAKVQGRQSVAAQLNLRAPVPEIIGRTLKENLMVPPKAGGRQANAKIPSGGPPIYVKVEPGSTLLIANYSFHEKDEQSVDLDGQGRLLPSNGPAGLPASYLEQFLRRVGDKSKLLLARGVPLGALVGSFDNFRTAFSVAEGVQVKVPAGANFLALGINDLIGLFDDNTGTGFRVKIVQRSEKNTASVTSTTLKTSFAPEATAQQPPRLQILPLSEVMPTLCISGYEDTRQTRTIGGTSHELFRYIGNVCWGVINVFPRNRSERPDQGDPFSEKQRR